MDIMNNQPQAIIPLINQPDGTEVKYLQVYFGIKPYLLI